MQHTCTMVPLLTRKWKVHIGRVGNQPSVSPLIMGERERVELFLGGVHSSSVQRIKSFLKSIAGVEFEGEVQVMLEGSRGRATLTGRRAGIAAVSMLGRRAEGDRPLEEVQLHNEWYCPCGLSGERPLAQQGRCMSCEQPRPGALLDALGMRAPCPVVKQSHSFAALVSPDLPQKLATGGNSSLQVHA